MANNTVLLPGGGGDTIAGEDILGVKYQLVKLVDPTALSVLPIGTLANPLRTDPSGTTVQPVSAVTLPLPLGSATSSKQDTSNTALGAPADVEAAGDGSIIALLKRLRTLLGSLGLDATLVAIRDRLPATLVGGRLDVNVGNTPSVTVSGGSITANAGTNLNTSALALEAGGNLATIAGKDFATSAKQSDGTQKSIVRGGAKGATAAADITSTASGADHQPIDVAIYDAAGAQVTSFGGGTQYATGASPATPTGTAAFGLVSDFAEHSYNDGEMRPLSMNNSGRLRVSSVPADVDMEFFRMKNSICSFDIPDLTDGGDPWTLGSASPFP